MMTPTLPILLQAEQSSLRDVHILTPEPCGYVSYMTKRIQVADAIKVANQLTLR